MAMAAKSNSSSFLSFRIFSVVIVLSLLVFVSDSARHAFRRDPGHPQWHHSAFHDVRDSVQSDVRRMLHSRAEVNFLLIFMYRIYASVLAFGLAIKEFEDRSR